MSNLCNGTTNVPKLRESKAYCEGRAAAAASWSETYATATTGVIANDNALTWTAKVSGDLIEIFLVDPGENDAELAVTVDGYAITASLATGAEGAITTTGDLLKAAIAGTAASNALVSVADTSTSDGSGEVVAEYTRLTGSTHPHAQSLADITAFNAGVTSWSADPTGVPQDCCADAYGGGFGD